VKRTFVCRADEIPDGEGRRVELDPPVAVYRVGDQFYVTADSCTHEQWSLGEEGDLDGYEVTCTLHLARFDVRTGRALCLPATRALETYPVVVENGDVYLTEAGTSEDGTPLTVAQGSER
jgi:nitrite reductase/ring-hydroxylating ferredoxin subunit